VTLAVKHLQIRVTVQHLQMMVGLVTLELVTMGLVTLGPVTLEPVTLEPVTLQGMHHLVTKQILVPHQNQQTRHLSSRHHLLRLGLPSCKLRQCRSHRRPTPT
jgi:hypothetical protein